MEYVSEMKGIFRETIDNFNWRVYVEEIMLNWKDSMADYDIKNMLPPVGPIDSEIHEPRHMSYSSPVCVWCVVCGLEASIWKDLKFNW